ncbi:MAG: phosphoribosylamine--glycine ligase [Calditerrivibrio sp.]|nr:phosphoribosylamine--glycine ligase [Calditerrivibrio sp.]
MKILVIGSGGREHAIAWKLAQSDKVSKVYCAPGNGGTATESKCENILLKGNEFDGLIDFVKKNEIYMTVVGPEDPLSKGIVDRFNRDGLRIFGPIKDAARLESSKVFAKEVMFSAGIPTAHYREFSNFKDAKNYIEEKGVPIVVKADGLAAGKGVTVARTMDEAIGAIREIFIDNIFGDAGSKVVIEEFLEGEEASFIAITDGETILPFASSQDHKTVFDDDKGPNTGGMGAYSPAPVVSQKVHDITMERVMIPLMKEMRKRGILYKGFIYAGLMIKGEDVKVLEFNCRLGDPETQPLLFRMKSDMFDLLNSAIDVNLKNFNLEWYDEYSVGVVLTSGGYPKEFTKGFVIDGLDRVDSSVKVFHAGTSLKHGSIVTDGGRVLCVTARDRDLKLAISKVYREVAKINFEGCHYRKDIGKKGLRR